MSAVRLKGNVVNWIRLSRPAFHSVGVLPFVLGTVMAWRIEGVFNLPVFILGTLAVILVMLSTYQAGEYFDFQEDSISKSIFSSRFAGGSGVMQEGVLPRRVPLWTSVITMVVATLIGIVLQFVLDTGIYTIPLGAVGLFCGFFYSTRPLRLVERGVGELVIGFCYGWLPVAAAFYIQAGYVNQSIHLISLPIALTIFNVIFLNEFLDIPGDRAAGKRNLLIRLGTRKSVLLYCAASVLAWLAMFTTITAGVSPRALWLFLPVVLLSLYIVISLIHGGYRHYRSLELLCGLNIAVNLGTTGAYILAFL